MLAVGSLVELVEPGRSLVALVDDELVVGFGDHFAIVIKLFFMMNISILGRNRAVLAVGHQEIDLGKRAVIFVRFQGIRDGRRVFIYNVVGVERDGGHGKDQYKR